jgi:nitrogen fixation protein FixH
VLTGRTVLIWLIATFAVVLGVNGFFIARAIGTYPGEDVHDPYLQGIGFNRTLAERHHQATLGWQASVEAKRSAAATTITVTLVDPRRALPATLNLTGELRHPTDAERDRVLVFTRHDANTFIGRTSVVAAGSWDVVVRAKGNVPFEATRRLWLR